MAPENLPAVRAERLGKRYTVFDSPLQRLRHALSRGGSGLGREFVALADVSFELPRGQVLGVVGKNGAGKSTLLQMVCGTVRPTSGSIEVRGRVAALLELGAGFNPEFSGRENIFLNASVLGLSEAETRARYDGIVAFSELEDFIEQPVKTYSSGMYVRLAFAIATSVEPDILVIDEALSVGDGAFARKSFDRIMDLKAAGATILFCSHSMYHVQALCSSALWLEGGRVRMWDTAAKVTTAYETALVMGDARVPAAAGAAAPPQQQDAAAQSATAPAPDEGGALVRRAPDGTAVITGIEARADGVAGTELAIHSGRTTLEIRIGFASDPALPCPTAAIGIAHATGTVVSSASSLQDGAPLTRDAAGRGMAAITLPALPLLQGDYSVTVILACERGLHPYEIVERALRLRVMQTGLEKGLVTLPHHWSSIAVPSVGAT